MLADIAHASCSFRQSGMGDCPDEALRVHNSLKQFSSDFKNFVHGKAPVLYAYDLFVTYDLLESYTGDMPLGSEHSAESFRRVQDPRPGKPEKGSKAALRAADIVSVLKKPIVIEDTPEQEEFTFFATRNMELKAKRNSAGLAK